jgi:hypothetical protein
LSGNDIIVRDILFVYLLKILQADRAFAPFTVVELERSFGFLLPVDFGNETIRIRTGGNIDRVDRRKGITRIVDYKTGETADRINSIDDLFADDRKKELDGWLQTLLYCEAYLSEKTGITVRPSIYKVKELSSEKYSDTLRVRDDTNNDFLLDDYRIIRETFLAGLNGVITKIFSLSEPYRMTKNLNKCGYCPYRALCQR